MEEGLWLRLAAFFDFFTLGLFFNEPLDLTDQFKRTASKCYGVPLSKSYN